MHSRQQQILDSLRRIVRALRVSSRAAERDLGLSGAQLLVLQILGKETSLSINELADRTRTHQSSVSTVVTRLVEGELVERRPSPADARRSEVLLTARGRKLLQKAPQLAQERLISAISELTPNDQTELSALLKKVTHLAGFDEEAPSLFFEEETPEQGRKK